MNQNQLRVTILCGGSGTRLWPVSRSLYPKQFCQLFGNESLFQKTIGRNLKLAKSFTVVINQQQYFMGLDQAEAMKLSASFDFILEPVGRNTAPALALAALSMDPEEIMLVVPSDHLITLEEHYQQALLRATELAQQGFLVTFGIHPSYPETGYGYIEAQGEDVISFKEKPDSVTATTYLKSGNYSWNSGMFCFKAKTLLNELKTYSPNIYQASLEAWNEAIKNEGIRIRPELMQAIPSDSIDYAVMEKSRLVKVVKADMGWTDVGSFDALYDSLPKDDSGNTLSQNTIHLGSKNNLVIGQERLISTIDIDDLMIIDTEDALVIAKKGSTQKVKDLVAEVKKQRPYLTEVHTTAHRPWGTYTLLNLHPGHKVNQLKVKPGKGLSFQYHLQRSEHWVVLSGVATVTLDDKTFELKASESTFIPKGCRHRLMNLTQEDLILIEVQVGPYLKEDDIVRL